MPLTKSKLLRINVSDDRLIATMALNGELPGRVLTAQEIEQELRELKLQVSDEGHKNIEVFAGQLAAGKLPNAVVVARGKGPEHDRNGRFEKLYEKVEEVEVESESEEGSESSSKKSHYERTNIISVAEGDGLIRLVPPVSGKDGVDVYGKPIARKIGREVSLKLGLNVRQEGDTIYAVTAGKLDFAGDKIYVSPKLEINGNVDFSVGNIDFAGEVIISKNVLDLFKVQSKSDVSIMGIAEAAEVHAGTTLTITGGITGKEKGRFSAGKDLKSKYITNAEVQVTENVWVRTEIVNCQLHCGGCVTVENGPLVGGHIIATGGAKVKYLGSEAGVKTLLEVGMDDSLRQKYEEVAPEVTVRRRKAVKIRQVVEPLLQNQKFLMPEQAEKATELLYQASELEDSVTELVSELRAVYESVLEKGTCEVEVSGCAFAGVTIRFPRVETTLKQSYSGPLKIIPQKVKGTLQVVAVDSKGGSQHVLPSGASRDDIWGKVDSILNPPKEQGYATA